MWYIIIYLPQTSWLVHKPRVGSHLSREIGIGEIGIGQIGIGEIGVGEIGVEGDWEWWS